MHSLDLRLDDATDARIRAIWHGLADAGLPSQAHHRGSSNAPHVTLLTRVTLTLAEDAVDIALPLPVTLGSALVLGRGARRVVALLVVPSLELLMLQAAVTRAVGREGGGSGADGSSFDAPGLWTPHITLARDVHPDDLGRVLEAVGDIDDTDASVVSLHHWDSDARTLTRLAPSGGGGTGARADAG